MSKFADKIVELCINKYKSLKKTGKPCENEWTVLSGIVLKKESELGDNLSVIALATGTKCLGAKELENLSVNNLGDRLSDSHAEVLARRALQRYLYEQIDQLFSLKISDVFVLDNERKIGFKSGVSFHFYCSQTPCGDCSIILKNRACEDDEYPVKIRKTDDFNWKTCDRLIVEQEEDIPIKDIHRTGAKCVRKEQIQDSYQPGVDYHVTGPLRTKPGRGDPTMSLSCSDKMAKWNFLGVQGALLSLLIPKFKFTSITIGGECPYSLEAMKRGLYLRFNTKCTSSIVQSSVGFMHLKSGTRRAPCPSSIIWCAVKNRNHEVAVQGRKQGLSKNQKGSCLLVSRRALFEKFLQIVDKYMNFHMLHPKKITFYDCKQSSEEYQKMWNHLKQSRMKAWPAKPQYLQKFSL